MSLGGGEPRLVAGGPNDEAMPRWSPDGSRIAFLSDDGTGMNVYWVPPTGGTRRKIAQTHLQYLDRFTSIGALGSQPWSPDGRRLVFSRLEPTNSVALWTADIESGQEARLTSPPPGASDWRGAWSHDGKEIAFHRTSTGSPPNLYLVNASGGGPRAMFPSKTASRGAAAWSLDDHSLLFVPARTVGWRPFGGRDRNGADQEADGWGQRQYPDSLVNGAHRLLALEPRDVLLQDAGRQSGGRARSDLAQRRRQLRAAFLAGRPADRLSIEPRRAVDAVAPRHGDRCRAPAHLSPGRTGGQNAGLVARWDAGRVSLESRRRVPVVGRGCGRRSEQSPLRAGDPHGRRLVGECARRAEVVVGRPGYCLSGPGRTRVDVVAHRSRWPQCTPDWSVGRPTFRLVSGQPPRDLYAQWRGWANRDRCNRHRDWRGASPAEGERNGAECRPGRECCGVQQRGRTLQHQSVRADARPPDSRTRPTSRDRCALGR